MKQNLIKTYNLILMILIIFSFYCVLNIGLSWDEFFHYINGKVRFDYILSFGQNKNFNFSNNIYYPGFFDTFSYSLTYIINLINSKLLENYFVEIRHIINFFFPCFRYMVFLKL